MSRLIVGEAVFAGLTLSTDVVNAEWTRQAVSTSGLTDGVESASRETANTFELIEILECACKQALTHAQIETDHSAEFVGAGVALTENNPIAPNGTVVLHGTLVEAKNATRKFKIEVLSEGVPVASAFVTMVKVGLGAGNEPREAMPYSRRYETPLSKWPS